MAEHFAQLLFSRAAQILSIYKEPVQIHAYMFLKLSIVVLVCCHQSQANPLFQTQKFLSAAMRVTEPLEDVAQVAGNLDDVTDVAKVADKVSEAADISLLSGNADEIADATALLDNSDEITDVTGFADNADEIADATGLVDNSDEITDISRAGDSFDQVDLAIDEATDVNRAENDWSEANEGGNVVSTSTTKS